MVLPLLLHGILVVNQCRYVASVLGTAYVIDDVCIFYAQISQSNALLRMLHT